MVAAFLGLRLYSVLGKRTGHEQQPAPQTEERAPMSVLTPKPVEDLRPELVRSPEGMVLPAAETGIRAIIATDRRFDVNQLAEGAKSAFRRGLEAFWKGKRDERGYEDDADVHASLDQAIDSRRQAGQTLENRVIRIEEIPLAKN